MVVTKNSSSPPSITSSWLGVSGRSSRRIATTVALAGHGTMPMVWPMSAESCGTVNSTIDTTPDCRVIRRTRSPISTASSTSAVIRRGVLTATSTPQASSNIQSFLGLLTRPTVRPTPNSLLASRETTRLTLSSPVAETTTSTSSSFASLSTLSSQASPKSQRAPRTPARETTSGFSSMSSTSCPWEMSSLAMELPTEPAPAIMTFMGVSTP